MSAGPARYWNPYAAGIALGVVLLLTFLAVGRGLGASGAFVRVVAEGVQQVSPERAEANPVYRSAGDEGGPLDEWLLVEVAGMMLGGALSAKLAGRWRRIVERGATTSAPSRLLLAVAGGAVMAIGARLARGCTSGQALSGGAVLSAGSWAFMIALFAGAYAAVSLSRRQWR
jgi:uncharacterized membrane protein YedE/YeeE